MDNQVSSSDWEIFTHNVAWLRMHYGLSKKQMAQLLMIGVGSLTKLENGKLPPRLDISVFFCIWKHFGISPKDQLEKRLDP